MGVSFSACLAWATALPISCPRPVSRKLVNHLGATRSKPARTIPRLGNFPELVRACAFQVERLPASGLRLHAESGQQAILGGPRPARIQKSPPDLQTQFASSLAVDLPLARRKPTQIRCLADPEGSRALI